MEKIQGEKKWWKFLRDRDFAEVDKHNLKDLSNLFKGDSYIDAPCKVKGVGRLKGNLLALAKLFSTELPPMKVVRAKECVEVIYGFGNASGAGFGAFWEDMKKQDKISYRIGVWNQEASLKSSNFRELTNLLEIMENLTLDKKMWGREVFLFTDNSTCENAFYKGTSASASLFELILRLRNMTLHKGIKLHLIYMSGTRMIDQGTDSLSRGDLLDGVMSGKTMLLFIPLHLSAVTRCDTLLPLILSWLEEDGCLLKPEDWFYKGQDIVLGGNYNNMGLWHPKIRKGKWIWTPPPGGGCCN